MAKKADFENILKYLFGGKKILTQTSQSER